MERHKHNTFKEFREFAFKGNVIDLAVGVVIGAAFQKIVTSVVDGLFMPLISLFLPSGNWRDYTVHIWKAQVKVGNLLGSTLDFVIVALVLFFVVKRLLEHLKRHDPAPPVEETRECPACLEKIRKQARRCKFCTEAVEPVAEKKVEEPKPATA